MLSTLYREQLAVVSQFEQWPEARASQLPAPRSRTTLCEETLAGDVKTLTHTLRSVREERRIPADANQSMAGIDQKGPDRIHEVSAKEAHSTST